MRLPFFDPPRDEVAAVASDLIVRFGLNARDEALFLAGLSEQMHARWNRRLYRLAAREIEMSFAEARRRLDVEAAPEAGMKLSGRFDVTTGAMGGVGALGNRKQRWSERLMAVLTKQQSAALRIPAQFRRSSALKAAATRSTIDSA